MLVPWDASRHWKVGSMVTITRSTVLISHSNPLTSQQHGQAEQDKHRTVMPVLTQGFLNHFVLRRGTWRPADPALPACM